MSEDLKDELPSSTKRTPKPMPLPLKLVLAAFALAFVFGIYTIGSGIIAKNAPEPYSNPEDTASIAEPASAEQDQNETLMAVEETFDVLDVTADQDTEIEVIPPEPVQDRKDLDAMSEWVQEIETRQEDSINIVKSSVEMQEQAKVQLSSLVKELDALSDEVTKLKTPTKARKVVAKRKVASKPKKTPTMTLLGVDKWGDERFAQFQEAGVVQLVALNEMIGDWKVVSIKNTAVTVTHKEGDKVELKVN